MDYRERWELKDYLIGRRLERRILAIHVAFGLALAVFLLNFWYLQGVHGEEYAILAENNRMRRVEVSPTRGVIYDRSDRVVASTRPSLTLWMTREDGRDLEAQLQRLVLAKPGDFFNLNMLTRSAELMSFRLGEEGYANAASYINWDDAREFCKKLSAKENRTYRLPTEAEWEYACRAGTQTRYHFGDESSDLGTYAWFDDNAYDIGEKYAHRVGQKRPNGFGLYDMHGNVREWCQDWYETDYYHQFLIEPEDIVMRQVHDWFSDAGMFGNVLRWDSTLEATHAIKGYITMLYGDFSDESSFKAVMEIEFTLVDLHGDKPQRVIEKTYHAEMAFDSRDAAKLIHGYGQCLEEILADLEMDVAEQSLE